MNEPNRDRVQELRTLASEVSNDVYLALEAHGIFRAIGERVELAKASAYQPLLAAIQSYASAEFVLALTRLLERQRAKYELHSVHGALQFLRDNARDIPVIEPLWVQQSMARLGVWQLVPQEPGLEQTRAIVDALLSKLPHHTNSESLKALKDLRDKRIAHPERAKLEALPTTSWAEALRLLEIPIEALGLCGAYTGTVYLDEEGKFFMEPDAGSAGSATQRLLETARMRGARSK